MVQTKVTPNEISQQIGYLYVVTDEGTTSTSYAGLATSQAVTINVGVSGQVMVSLTAGIYNVAAQMRMSVAVSGATTVAASDNYSLRADSASFLSKTGGTFLITGLTPGSNTFTAQFKTNSGTARFFERSLYVEAK